MRRTPSVLAVLPVLVFALGACGGDAERDESGEVSAKSDVSAHELREGDCIASTADGEVANLTAIPCDEPHGAEAFHSYEFEDGDFPGADTIKAEADQECSAAFEEFVGINYNESALNLQPLTPTEESWSRGDRAVLCLVSDPDAETTGSLEGAAR